MITTKDNKPVIQQECKNCEGMGRVPNGVFMGTCKCEICNGTGHTYTEIPDKYTEEVERLLKVEKPNLERIGREMAVQTRNRTWEEKQKYTQAQQMLSEIEQEILKG